MQVQGAWQFGDWVEPSMFSGDPLAVDMQPTPPDDLHVRVGQPVPLEVYVVYRHYNLLTHTAAPFALSAPLVFGVEIVKGTAPDQVIWRGVLPPWTGGIATINARFAFTWDQRDAAGTQVAPGDYTARLRQPLPTAQYVLDGQAGQEQLPPGHMGQTDQEVVTISG